MWRLLILCVLLSLTSASDLSKLLRQRRLHHTDGGSYMMEKRGPVGNPCVDIDKPFPCKNENKCIPVKYICDENEDCDDGYDESDELCTAAHRPPVEEIIQFLNANPWILKALFEGKPIARVAHALAVSPNMKEFKTFVDMTDEDVGRLRDALDSVRNDDRSMMEAMGMPKSAWTEVKFIFSNLLKSHFN